MRQDDLQQLQSAINALQSRGGSQTQQSGAQFQIQQLRAQIQRIQLKRDADRSFSIASQAPAFVSLVLGSAYFRQERFADAEREYKAAVDANSASGETHNNLAVLYMPTGRLEEATSEVRLAEKTGFKVNPQLKQDLEAKRKGKS